MDLALGVLDRGHHLPVLVLRGPADDRLDLRGLLGEGPVELRQPLRRPPGGPADVGDLLLELLKLGHDAS